MYVRWQDISRIYQNIETKTHHMSPAREEKWIHLSFHIYPLKLSNGLLHSKHADRIQVNGIARILVDETG